MEYGGGGVMKWMMTINLYMMPLKNILEINYIYGSLKKPMTKDILWRVTIFCISRIMDERGGYLEKNEDDQK